MTEVKSERIDPTSLLPEEPMVYEFKKKKKKKKRKHRQEDPFKDIGETAKKPVVILQDLETEEVETRMEPTVDPEVNIKVENIEVELAFSEFANQAGLMLESTHRDEVDQEPAVQINSQQNGHDAVILTFENIISEHSIFGVKEEPKSEPMHICNVCHLVFKSERTLNTHQRHKHKAYKKTFLYKCDDCGMSYDQRNSLIAHFKRKHGPNSVPDDNEDRPCEICSLVFKGNMRLRMHMQRKHGSFTDSFTFECLDCGLTYDKYRSLLVHRKRKHSKIKVKKVKQWMSCPICQRGFSNRDTYARHIQRKHNKEKEEKIPKELLDNLAEVNPSGEVPCRECPLVFSSVMYLKLHMRRQHNAFNDDFRLKCGICNLSYDKVESLKRHVRRKHGTGNQCTGCNKSFETEEEFLTHSHDRPIIECQICGLIFASAGGLQKHLRCTHKVDLGPKTVFCHICKEGFYENRQLKAHVMKKHLNIKYPCRFCSKQFKTKESFRRHILRFHSNNYPATKSNHKCSVCDKLFPNEFELCRHFDVEHAKSMSILTVEIKSENEIKKEVKKEDEDEEVTDNDKPLQTFQCTKCPDTCPTWEDLRKHYEQFHHVMEETQCQSCGDFFPESELQKHIKIKHPIEVIMKCPYCEYKTTSKVSLTQHTLRHKNATTLTCDYPNCRYKSYFVAAMEKHKQRHAELGVKLQCAHCPFQTMNKYILRYHEEVHTTGKKKYVCNQCDYATILPANLVQHKYKHSTIKRFKCEYCPFATKYNTSLRFHVKKKHCDLQV